MAFFLVRDGWLSNTDASTLSLVEKDYNEMITMVPILIDMDFNILDELHHNYAVKHEIDHQCAMALIACVVHYGLNFGLVVCYIRHEYVGAH